MNRQQIVQAADTWLGTPFVHQGRKKHVAIDCAGYLYLLGLEVGADTKGYIDKPVYGVDPDNTMEKIIDKHLKRRDKFSRNIASILFFRFSKLGQHVGIVSADTNYFYHAYEPEGKIVLTRYDKKWDNRLICSYDYYGLED